MNQFTATVLAADGARFAASASSAAALEERVASYIQERCDDVLWPADAADVHSLIDSGRFDAAIAAYFANVGQRWDAEWLELNGLSLGNAAGAAPGADAEMCDALETVRSS